MARLFITEYSQTKLVEGRGNAPIADEESFLQTQVLDFTSGEDHTTLHTSTIFVRLQPDAVCSVKYAKSTAAAPIAATTDRRMPADTVEYFGVQGGGQYSAIANT